MSAGERFGLVLLAVFAGLVVLVFTSGPTARGDRARAEAQRTLAEIELRAHNRRVACYQGVADACR